MTSPNAVRCRRSASPSASGPRCSPIISTVAPLVSGTSRLVTVRSNPIDE
ncbi:hypothetical protein JNW89_24305 [Micromonospora sp. 4G55]|nr:hypothetical protein [Micromonospora sp. 4G55]MBM0259388.1 hypothetical protein [Micromonospora sp. 4G55]